MYENTHLGIRIDFTTFQDKFDNLNYADIILEINKERYFLNSIILSSVSLTLRQLIEEKREMIQSSYISTSLPVIELIISNTHPHVNLELEYNLIVKMIRFCYGYPLSFSYNELKYIPAVSRLLGMTTILASMLTSLEQSSIQTPLLSCFIFPLSQIYLNMSHDPICNRVDRLLSNCGVSQFVLFVYSSERINMCWRMIDKLLHVKDDNIRISSPIEWITYMYCLLDIAEGKLSIIPLSFEGSESSGYEDMKDLAIFLIAKHRFDIIMDGYENMMNENIDDLVIVGENRVSKTIKDAFSIVVDRLEILQD